MQAGGKKKKCNLSLFCSQNTLLKHVFNRAEMQGQLEKERRQEKRD